MVGLRLIAQTVQALTPAARLEQAETAEACANHRMRETTGTEATTALGWLGLGGAGTAPGMPAANHNECMEGPHGGCLSAQIAPLNRAYQMHCNHELAATGKMICQAQEAPPGFLGSWPWSRGWTGLRGPHAKLA